MRRLLPLLVLAALAFPAGAGAATLPTGPNWYKDPSVNATWSQAYITEADGTMLHADILRPAGVKATDKTPVIMSVGPYFNHSGEVDPTENPVNTEAGPSERFVDFVVGGRLMQKGYTYVMVDLRGFGGSTGCSDFGGTGEQADVKTAVEWAAKAGWSTGSVGLYGKSYDAVTGLIGEVTQPQGLKGIIAQEPVYNEYNYLYTNKVKFANFAGTPAIYQQLAADPGVVGADDPTYQVNAAMSAQCIPTSIGAQSADDDPNSTFWKAHDYAVLAKGHTVPLFLTQGFLEDNTKPLGAWRFYNAIAGPKRGWFAMNDHIRGNDQDEGDNSYPRFFDEAMRWFDHYVAGKSLAEAPVDADPANEVETDDGTWRAESAWPPVDSIDYTVPLKTGTYTDDASNDGSKENAGGMGYDAPGTGGIWTISPPMTSDQRYSGVPQAHIDVTATVPMANLAVNTYDIDAANKATLLSRSTYLLSMGEQKLDFELYGNDWRIPTGHRVGILVSGSNSEWWNHVPTMTDVTLNKGSSVTVPFLKYTRTETIPGKLPTRLAKWKTAAPFAVPAATITSGTSTAFPVIPAPTAAPKDAPVTSTATNTAVPTNVGTVKPAGVAPKRAALRLTAALSSRRAKGVGRHVTVRGAVPVGAKLVVKLLLHGKVVATRRVTATTGRYHVTIKVKKKGTYSARVTAVATDKTGLKATARTYRLRQ